MELMARPKTLRLISNGMYVITSRAGGRYRAATVTWISQASFKPPLIIAAIRTDSNVFKCMSESGVAEAECRDLVRPLTIAESPREDGG
jgi:flavin reductase (DIM6/NTAB) family NADH-FMN oxidoreductase RutF